MNRFWFLIPFVFFSVYSQAQIDSLTMDLNLTTRFEGNNGYSNLIPKHKKMKSHVGSRARVGMNFYMDKLEIRIAPQDARVWGNTSSSKQSETLSFYEAWAKYNFNNYLYLKAGRQIIKFANGRVISDSNWGMRGKSFDAFKLGYNFSNGSSLDAVVTYNSQSTKRNDDLQNEIYEISEGGEKTKSIQLVSYESSKENNFIYSILAMNSVVQTDEKKHNSLTTLGLELKQKFNERLNITLNAYYQTGKNTLNQSKNAYDLSLDINYIPFSIWDLSLGAEILSGTKYDESPTKNTSFSPLYGTSHTFNGSMDYFYSSNHFNGPGLIDFYLKNNFNLNQLGELSLALHYFSTHKKFNESSGTYLGTEIDLVYGKKISNDFLFNLGYSQMFAANNLKVLKEVNQPKSLQNFVWIGLSFTPQFKLL